MFYTMSKESLNFYFWKLKKIALAVFHDILVSYLAISSDMQWHTETAHEVSMPNNLSVLYSK